MMNQMFLVIHKIEGKVTLKDNLSYKELIERFSFRYKYNCVDEKIKKGETLTVFML